MYYIKRTLYNVYHFSVENDNVLLIVFFFYCGNIIFHWCSHNNRLRSRRGFHIAVRVFRSSYLPGIFSSCNFRHRRRLNRSARVPWGCPRVIFTLQRNRRRRVTRIIIIIYNESFTISQTFLRILSY